MSYKKFVNLQKVFLKSTPIADSDPGLIFDLKTDLSQADDSTASGNHSKGKLALDSEVYTDVLPGVSSVQ